jgi:hypothetical protein
VGRGGPESPEHNREIEKYDSANRMIEAFQRPSEGEQRRQEQCKNPENPFGLRL